MPYSKFASHFRPKNDFLGFRQNIRPKGPFFSDVQFCTRGHEYVQGLHIEFATAVKEKIMLS